MYFVKITDCKGKEIQVEVSLEVFEEFIKFEKFDKMMEKRDNRHLEKRELSDILIEKHCMVKPVSIEDKYIQNELICKMLSKLHNKCTITQQHRFILHYLYNQSFIAIARSENKSDKAIIKSVTCAKKKIL